MLHTVQPAGFISDGVDGVAVVPFAFSGVQLWAAGATVVRARLVLVGDGQVQVEVADPTGLPVARVDTLALRPITTPTSR